MIYKILYSLKLFQVARQEGITKQELQEAITAIIEAATDPTKPLHLNTKQEPITSTKSLWYRLRPSKASKYRLVYSLPTRCATRLR